MLYVYVYISYIAYMYIIYILNSKWPKESPQKVADTLYQGRTAGFTWKLLRVIIKGKPASVTLKS